MTYAELNHQTIREGFNAFIEANPHVYAEFERQVFAEIKSGRTKISSKRIVNNMRWSELQTDDKQFKINDATTSYLSRMFAEKNPQHKDVFEFRKLRNETDAPYMIVEPNGQLAFL